MINVLEDLCALDGVSGNETSVREYILKELTHPAEIDAMGNIIVRLPGKKRAMRTVMLAAHMDEVGLIITDVTEDGYLRFSAVGGIDSTVIYGKRVKINGVTGVIGGKAVHQCEGDEKRRAPGMDKLLIDIGCDTREDALRVARPGDNAAFENDAVWLGDRLKAKAIDDRAGCAVLLELARNMPEYDLVLAFTVQEEVGLRGAKTAAFSVRPDAAIIIDATTAADVAGVAEEKQVCALGNGAVVPFMDRRTLYDRGLYLCAVDTAAELDIGIQTKTTIAGGNDAGAVQLTANGAKVISVSVPCRYLHSGACVADKNDMKNVLALVTALAKKMAGE